MKNYRVTALVAHHNYQEFLGDAIESVQKQTYPCHVCIIDDYSDDQELTKTVVNQKLFHDNPPPPKKKDNLIIQSNEDGTIIYITDKNYKQAYARNRGIEELWDKTDIFIVLDADDEMYPTKVEKCVEAMAQGNEIGAVYADHDTVHLSTGRSVREYREAFSLNKLRRECIVHSGSAISKLALEQTKEDNYFDEDLPPVEDYDMWLRIAEKFMIIHIPESLSLVKVQPKNCTYTVPNEKWQQQHQKLFQKLLKRNGQS